MRTQLHMRKYGFEEKLTLSLTHVRTKVSKNCKRIMSIAPVEHGRKELRYKYTEFYILKKKLVLTAKGNDDMNKMMSRF